MSDYEATPYDGHHTQGDSEHSWRTISRRALRRLRQLGRTRQPHGSRRGHYIAQQRKQKSDYDPYVDPHMLNNPRLSGGRRDGCHGAASRSRVLPAPRGGFGVLPTCSLGGVCKRPEGTTSPGGRYPRGNGPKWQPLFRCCPGFGRGLQGFSARVSWVKMPWIGRATAPKAASGVGNFVNGARNWNSLGDAASGIGQEIRGAGTGWQTPDGKLGKVSQARTTTSADLAGEGALSVPQAVS